MKIATKRAFIAATALLLTVGTLTACSSTTGAKAGSGSGSTAVKIGLLLPDSVTARYASADKPYFEAEVKRLAPKATVLYANADGDASKQQQQAESMLSQGVKVLVLDAQDGTAAQQIVTEAQAKKVPVIDYDRLVAGGKSDYYISFDNEKVGELQATALVAQMKKLGLPDDAGYVMINGSPTDNNATLFKQGATKVLSATKYKLLSSFDTPAWTPALAQTWMDGQVTQFGHKIQAVYAANDGTGEAAIASMKAAGWKSPLPPVTGQDASLAGIQDILSGDQYMTIYKAFLPEANKAADLAVDLIKGKKPSAPTKVSGVPSFLLTPVAVTVDNIQDTVVKDKLYTVAQICTSAFAAACTKAGIQ